LVVIPIAGPEEAKNLAGEVLRLIQIRFDSEFWKNLAPLVKPIRRNREPPLHSTNLLNFFIRSHNETLSSSRCASTI